MVFVSPKMQYMGCMEFEGEQRWEVHGSGKECVERWASVGQPMHQSVPTSSTDFNICPSPHGMPLTFLMNGRTIFLLIMSSAVPQRDRVS